MSCANEIPRISGPGEPPIDSESRLFEDSQSSDPDGKRIVRYHFWRKLFSGEVRCGESTEFTQELRSGISETVLHEISGSLEITLGALKSSVSPKASESTTAIEERKFSYTRKITADKCHARTYAEWQKVQRIRIAVPRTWLGLIERAPKVQSVDIPLNEFCPDTYIYPFPNCCPNNFGQTLRDGFDSLYAITFGGVTSLALGRSQSRGLVEIAEVVGLHRPASTIIADTFRRYFEKLGVEITEPTGYLSSRIGPATALLDLGKTDNARFPRVLSSLLVAGFVAFLVYRLARSQSGIVRTERLLDTRELVETPREVET